MWRVEVRCPAGREEITLAGFTGYDIAAAETGSCYACAWFTSQQEAGQCAASLGGIIEPVEAENWNQTWQAGWTATAVGHRFWLSPPWDETPPPPGRIRLDMHPGMLFGNGDHPTTQLCLAALERHIAPGCTMLDVGCGSGLLIQAANLLGARIAIGCDLDPEAASTATNAFQGTVDAIASGSVDVLVANIQLGVLVEILPNFDRVLKPAGVMILSGILKDQIPDFPRQSGTWSYQDDWACVTLPGASAGNGETQ